MVGVNVVDSCSHSLFPLPSCIQCSDAIVSDPLSIAPCRGRRVKKKGRIHLDSATVRSSNRLATPATRRPSTSLG